jgi:chromosome segregation ATPase
MKLLALVTFFSFHGTTAVTPVSKVVQLLADLEAKITKEGEVEEKTFNEYMEWCDDGHKDKGFEIKTAKSEIEDLTATIGKATSDIESSRTKMEELASSISQDEADLQSASQIRAKENSEFKATEEELTDAIGMLDRAINVLSKKMKGSASLMQARFDPKNIKSMLSALNAVVDAAALSLHDKQKLYALAQTHEDSDDDGEDMGAPDPEAYKSHSSSIIDVLEDMREKAQGQLNEARKEEGAAKHNFAMLKQSLDDQIAADSKELAEAKASKAAAQETKAVAEGDLSVTQKGLADDEESLENLESDCKSKEDDHETSTKGRAEELKALAEAKAIISKATGGAAGRVYFLQLHDEYQRISARVRISTSSDLANVELVNMIKQLAKKQHSAALTQLAGRIAAALKYAKTSGEDPFAKVKSLITDMISKLESDAKSEASHKEYCDKELGTSKTKMDELSASISKNSAKKDKAVADSVKLKGEVQELQAELATISKSQSEVNKLRSAEHNAFVATKADLEQGIDGVRSALKVLREYYANEAALVQQPEDPGTHSKASGAGSSIISMLEVIASDFSKSLAAEEIDEDSAAVEYEKTSQMNRVTKSMKEKDVEYKTKEAASLDKSTIELTSDVESAQSELDAVMEYNKGLIGACVAKPETYEERKGRREAEVQGLKQALQILEGSSLLQEMQGNSGLRGVSAGPHNK